MPTRIVPAFTFAVLIVLPPGVLAQALTGDPNGELIDRVGEIASVADVPATVALSVPSEPKPFFHVQDRDNWPVDELTPPEGAE